MESAKIKVIGKVQGVAFRYYTKIQADKLNIKGTVQNLSDGSVLIYAYSSSIQLFPAIRPDPEVALISVAAAWKPLTASSKVTQPATVVAASVWVLTPRCYSIAALSTTTLPFP